MNQETRKANSYRRTAAIVGVLFIIGTVSGVLSVGLLETTETTQGTLDLSKVAANENQVLIGALLIFIMAAACASTAIWMYPVLKKYNEALALGAVGFRLVEGMLMVVTAVSVLVLLTLSREFVKTGAADASYFQTFGVMIQAGYNWVYGVPMLLAWCTAAMMYYYIFYQTKLIPRWISLWGIIGITLSAMAALLLMFGVLNASMAIHTLMNLPIALQEMVMAVWLILKGFDPAAVDALSARADRADVAPNAITKKQKA